VSFFLSLIAAAPAFYTLTVALVTGLPDAPATAPVAESSFDDAWAWAAKADSNRAAWETRVRFFIVICLDVGDWVKVSFVLVMFLLAQDGWRRCACPSLD